MATRKLIYAVEFPSPSGGMLLCEVINKMIDQLAFPSPSGGMLVFQLDELRRGAVCVSVPVWGYVVM